MSNKRLTAVWEHSQQSGSSLLALLSLADRADDDGFCWPSHRDTAQRARTSREYVAKLMKGLVSSGEIYTHARPGKTYQYLVIIGMTYREVDEALFNRFGYKADKRRKILENIAECWGVQFSGGVGSKGGEGVQFISEVGVQSVLDEPSYNPKYKPSIANSEKEEKDNPQNDNYATDMLGIDERPEQNNERMSKERLQRAAMGVGKHKPFANYPPETQEMLRVYAEGFREPYPDECKNGIATGWVKTVNIWLKRGYTINDLKAAIAHVKKEGMTVKRPGSITWAFDVDQRGSNDTSSRGINIVN